MAAARNDETEADQLALALTNLGMQRMTARVMARFIFTPQPALTQGELAEQLGASTGSVSTAVQTLTAVGLLERVPAGRSRRDHHRLRDDAWVTLFSRENEAITAMVEAAHRGIQATDADSPARRRLERMRDFYEFLDAELPSLAERWRSSRPSD